MTEQVKVYSYSSCSTCRKALKWLDEKNIKYELIDIIKNPPSKNIIATAIRTVDDKKNLFNTRGQSYRQLGAKFVSSMSTEQAIEALSNDGKLIKRPFLISSSGKFLLGFNELIWAQFFQN